MWDMMGDMSLTIDPYYHLMWVTSVFIRESNSLPQDHTYFYVLSAHYQAQKLDPPCRRHRRFGNPSLPEQ
jgi:hypothetical protein